MYKTKAYEKTPTSPCLVVVVTCIALGAAAQTARAARAALSARTAGLERHDGFFPYYWDEKKGDILFELSPAALQGEFLYFTGLGSGIGSIEAFADRSSFGAGRCADFGALACACW